MLEKKKAFKFSINFQIQQVSTIFFLVLGLDANGTSF